MLIKVARISWSLHETSFEFEIVNAKNVDYLETMFLPSPVVNTVNDGVKEDPLKLGSKSVKHKTGLTRPLKVGGVKHNLKQGSDS